MSPASPATRRICVIFDVEKYSARTSADHLAMQPQLQRVTERAAEHAGLRWRQIDVEKKGDGLLLQLPPGIDEPGVLPRLVNGFCSALRESNLRALSSRRLRVRMALTQGIQHPGPIGAIGESLIVASRLVDSPAARSLLDAHPEASLIVIVSDDLYRDVIAQNYPGLDPGEFSQVRAVIEEKSFEADAWVYVPVPRDGALSAPDAWDSQAARKIGQVSRDLAVPVAGATLGSVIGAAAALHAHGHAAHAADPTHDWHHADPTHPTDDWHHADPTHPTDDWHHADPTHPTDDWHHADPTHPTDDWHHADPDNPPGHISEPMLVEAHDAYDGHYGEPGSNYDYDASADADSYHDNADSAHADPGYDAGPDGTHPH
jgi:hypothetical protein